MIHQVVYFAIAMTLALALTPLAGRVAHRIGAVDYPGENKVHTGAVPRLGGLAIYLAIVGTLLLALRWDRPVFHLYLRQMWGLYLGGFVILGLGIYDDTRGSNAPTKLIAQSFAALLLYLHGVRIELLTNPFGQAFSLGALSLPLTILWVVALVNAFNLLDGLDGLAAGSACIAAAALFAVALHDQKAQVTILMLVLAGACTGFLRYNFFPAKIFMGDAGSMLLGLNAAVLLLLFAKQHQIRWVMGSIMVFGLPLADMLLTLARRWRNQRPLMVGDRSHFYDQLLDRGMPIRKVVTVSYVLAAFYAAAGCCAAIWVRIRYAVPLCALVAVATVAAIFAKEELT